MPDIDELDFHELLGLQLIREHGIRYAYNIAYVLAYRGEIDRSFHTLNKARENNNSGVRYASYQPLLKNLHGDPRWVPFLRKLGHAQEQLAGVDIELARRD